MSSMKRIIERLQGENESLKNKDKRHQRMGTLESENKRLKVILYLSHLPLSLLLMSVLFSQAELDRVQKSLAALGGGGGGGRGTAGHSLAGVISENERLRNELRKVIYTHNINVLFHPLPPSLH